jgi:hypothetical protein
MIQIENITADPHQEHTIEIIGGTVTLVLKYHNQIECWTMDITKGDKSVYGVRLATGTKHIESCNMGIEFYVVGDGDIDPFQLDDFETGRCALVMDYV